MTALMSVSANSDPVLLYPSGCGATRICVTVQSSISPAAILIYAAPQWQNVEVIIEGVFYNSPTGTGPVVVTAPGQYASSIVGLVLTAPDGSAITLTADFTGHRVYVGSGRGQHSAIAWTLTDGQIDGYTNGPNPFADPLPPPLDGGCEQGCHR